MKKSTEGFRQRHMERCLKWRATSSSRYDDRNRKAVSTTSYNYMVRNWSNRRCAPFTIKELQEATRKKETGKPTGSDGSIPEIIKVVATSEGDYCLTLINKQLAGGLFPKSWKKAKLVLLEKPKKTQTVQITYRT